MMWDDWREGSRPCPNWMVLFLLTSGLAAGCMSSQRKPFANNPLLLYYKPTLSDSATILAEQAARREPTQPPMPTFARDTSPGAPSLLRRSETDDIKPVKIDLPESDNRPIIRQSSAASQEPDLKIEAKLPVRPIQLPAPVSPTTEPLLQPVVLPARPVELQPVVAPTPEEKPVATATADLVVRTEKVDLPDVPQAPIAMSMPEPVAR